MNSWEKLEKTKPLPKNVFYSKLNIKGISDKTMNKHSKFGIP